MEMSKRKTTRAVGKSQKLQALWTCAGHTTPAAFPFHEDSQQSLNQPDTDSIPHPSDNNLDDNSHYVDAQDMFDWSSFDSVPPIQETAISCLAPSRGDTAAPAHLSAVARQDDLESRLLSLHPRKARSDPDSDSEDSSTSSVASTPTVNRATPQSGDNKKTHPPPSPNQESQGLACPFWKKDPNRHRKCFKLKGFRRIRDVKQHLRRRHLMPLFCRRCGMQFKDKDQSKNEVQLNKHMQAVDPCHPKKFKKPEGISQRQKELLAKHTARNSGAAAQWQNIWYIVFPSHKAKKPDSAFVYPDQSEDLSSFIDFMQIGGRPLLEGHYATMFNVDGVISIFNKIHDVWRSRRGLPPSIQPAWPVSSTSNIHLINDDAFTEAHAFTHPPSIMTESPPVAPGYDSSMTDLGSNMDWVIPDLFS
ncbi:hypothetical protein VM1G_02342 [Cytospora mali]|uniref:C2H2-type domain-containing protein n=1 Tax=Cytospora mali TaxID=578113 RepID=A0A194VR63_CYTMA|nr:hypothetical protein VM1G_02342 [Valsa mali]